MALLQAVRIHYTYTSESHGNKYFTLSCQMPPYVRDTGISDGICVGTLDKEGEHADDVRRMLLFSSAILKYGGPFGQNMISLLDSMFSNEMELTVISGFRTILFINHHSGLLALDLRIICCTEPLKP